jgi:hypothetical protein
MNKLLDRMAYDSLSFVKTGVATLAPKQGKRRKVKDTYEASKEEIEMCLACKKSHCGGYCNKVRYLELRK